MLAAGTVGVGVEAPDTFAGPSAGGAEGGGRARRRPDRRGRGARGYDYGGYGELNARFPRE
ncbi:hypothetical protein ACF09H_05475 [Streptomyces sp. NPDC014983]|uniref:hypothetical protein n=1 Tax=Streptomyces sp. NPDC014983 TaxID=3364933 RepID=UPI0036FBEB90